MSLIIRPRVPEDDELITAIHRATNPDRPPMTVEELRHMLYTTSPEAHYEMVVAELHGKVAGSAISHRRTWVGGYTWRLDIRVLPEYRRRGVGTALYEHGLQRATAGGAKKIFAIVREDQPEDEAFAERRGFQRTGHGDRISRLKVREAKLVRAHEADRTLRENGIRITTLAEMGKDEATLRALHQLDNDTAADIPGLESWTGMSYEDWLTDMIEAPGAAPELYWLALDGDRPVGVAPLHLRSEGFADNAYTGVAREYRGRGIARALKLRGIEWAAANGIEYLITGNDVENRAMLAVNIDLGYEMLPANIEMVKELPSSDAEAESQ